MTTICINETPCISKNKKYELVATPYASARSITNKFDE